MCNVPCSLCGDYDECEVRTSISEHFKIYNAEGNYIMDCLCTRQMAEQITFFNPDLSLILSAEN